MSVGLLTRSGSRRNGATDANNRTTRPGGNGGTGVLPPLLAAGGSEPMPRAGGSGEERESPEARSREILGDLCDVRRGRGQPERVVAGHDRHRNHYSVINPIGDHSFWLPRGGTRIQPRAHAPAGVPYCCGMPCGWLALTDDLRSPTRLILWDPLSQAEIPLPTLTTVAQVFLSGDPLTSPSWMAIASQKIPHVQLGQRLFFWRPGDAAWTSQLEYPNGRIEGAAFHHCRFYISTNNMTLDIFDLQQHPPKRFPRINLYPPLQVRYRRFPGRPVPHVVAWNNQMLLVMVYRGLYNATILAEVYSPDWAAQPLDLQEKVTDLGDYSLFLGRGDTLALSAKEFPAIRRNCVYFVEHDTAKHDRWLVVFDLVSNALERIPHPEEQREGGSKTSGWLGYSWFCPRRPFVQDQEPL